MYGNGGYESCYPLLPRVAFADTLACICKKKPYTSTFTWHSFLSLISPRVHPKPTLDAPVLRLLCGCTEEEAAHAVDEDVIMRRFGQHDIPLRKWAELLNFGLDTYADSAEPRVRACVRGVAERGRSAVNCSPKLKKRRKKRGDPGWEDENAARAALKANSDWQRTFVEALERAIARADGVPYVRFVGPGEKRKRRGSADSRGGQGASGGEGGSRPGVWAEAGAGSARRHSPQRSQSPTGSGGPARSKRARAGVLPEERWPMDGEPSRGGPDAGTAAETTAAAPAQSSGGTERRKTKKRGPGERSVSPTSEQPARSKVKVEGQPGARKHAAAAPSTASAPASAPASAGPKQAAAAAPPAGGPEVIVLSSDSDEDFAAAGAPGSSSDFSESEPMEWSPPAARQAEDARGKRARSREASPPAKRPKSAPIGAPPGGPPLSARPAPVAGQPPGAGIPGAAAQHWFNGGAPAGVPLRSKKHAADARPAGGGARRSRWDAPGPAVPPPASRVDPDVITLSSSDEGSESDGGQGEERSSARREPRSESRSSPEDGQRFRRDPHWPGDEEDRIPHHR